MKSLISFILSIIITAYLYGLFMMNIEIEGDAMFGLFFMFFGIFCGLHMILKGYILNWLSIILPCKILGCYMPSTKKCSSYQCPRCKQRYRTKYGRIFGGFGYYWEEDTWNYIKY